jgi:uncharacterized membrane protein
VDVLLAIGYPDRTTALRAQRSIGRSEPKGRPKAIAVAIRDPDGSIRTTTVDVDPPGGRSWHAFWGFLFDLLYFVPLFGAARGGGMGPPLAMIAKSGIGKSFQERARKMLAPGTSALFMVVDQKAADAAVGSLSAFGGTVARSKPSKNVGRTRTAKRLPAA